MKFKDFWGLNVGENAAIAVSLAAREEGATMGEISSHTGQKQYNVFKRFKEFGHHVAYEGKGSGMRIWIRHKDGIPASGDAASVSGDLIRRDELALQRLLRNSLDAIEPGLRCVDGGSEMDFRDITAVDAEGRHVVIELKAKKATKEALAQILAYMGEIVVTKGLPPTEIRGILIAPDFQERAVLAAKVTPNVALVRYRIPLAFDLVTG